jgi:hypothetical protein
MSTDSNKEQETGCSCGSCGKELIYQKVPVDQKQLNGDISQP